MIDELQLLRSLRGEVQPPGEEVREAAAAALAQAMAAEPDELRREAAGPRPRRRRRRAWVARIALSGAGLAVAAVVASALLRGGSPAGPPTAAAAVFHQLARAAAVQPTDVPGPGQYLYVHSRAAYEASNGKWIELVPQDRQIWIGADGSGRIDETFGTAEFLDAADRSAWQAAGSPSLTSEPWDTFFGAGCMSDGPTDLAALPTDPATLAQLIASRQIEGGPPGPAEDFVQVGDLLRETDASPALRSALYTVAADIPGVVSLGAVTDHSGRQGVGLAYDSHGDRSELIFDPSSGALMGEETIILTNSAGGPPAGTLTGWAVYVDSSIVDSDTSPADPSAGHVVPVSPLPADSGQSFGSSGAVAAPGTVSTTTTSVSSTTAAATSSGETSSGATSSGETSSGETSSGETSSGETSSGETSSGETSSGETSSGETSSGETSSGEMTSTAPSSAETSSGETSAGASQPDSASSTAPLRTVPQNVPPPEFKSGGLRPDARVVPCRSVN